MRAVLALSLVLAACTDPVEEEPVIENQVTSCGPSARLVRDVCTELGPVDDCVEVDDVCVALCDQATSCTTVGELRAVHPWPVAPDGYCVACAVP